MGLLVYPPLEHKTDSSSIFFIGFAQSYCRIDAQLVDLIYSGNFCPVLPLEIGENIFDIDIDGEIFNCKVTRTVKNLSIKHNPQNLNEDSEDEYKETDGGFQAGFKRICIDPGHGGLANGTCSPKGIKEKDLNLRLAKLLREKLLPNGFEVLLTREQDIDLSLSDRVTMSKNFRADLFISIHHNAIPDYQNPLEHRGISAHYYHERSKSFADKLLNTVLDRTHLPSAGLIRQDLHVLRENLHSVSILLEMGYLIHPIESEIIVDDEFQEKAAQGILDFLIIC